MKALGKRPRAALRGMPLAACGGQDSGSGAQASAASAGSQPAAEAKREIRFGTTPGDFADMIKDQIQPMLEKQGYTVTLTEFPDYVTPNQALAEGAIDINIFQHKPYLDSFKAEHNLDLTEVFQVPTAPLGIYPGKLTALDQVKNGSSVSISSSRSARRSLTSLPTATTLEFVVSM